MARLEFAFLRSRVASRVFLTFVLAAAVPTIMLVVLAAVHLSGFAEKMTYRELTYSGKSYAMSLLERLAATEEEIAALTARSAAGREPRGINTGSDSVRLRSVRIARETEFGPISPEARRKLEAGGAVITLRQESGLLHVVLLRAVNPARPGFRVLAAEIDPGYLWGEPDALPYETDICVLDDDGRALFCPRPVPESVRASISARSEGSKRLAWSQDQQEFAGSLWTLFLAARYAAPSWTVVTSRPQAGMLAQLGSFRSVFLPAVAVAVLLTVLLTAVQIRRRMDPLESLIRATRRIGERDFSMPVALRTGDEFEELGNALDSMAVRLGRQFSALATWSETDRMILAEPDVDRVLTVLLSQSPSVVPADVWSVIVIEDPVLGLCRAYVRSAADNGRVVGERTGLVAADIDALMARADTGVFYDEGRIPSSFGVIAKQGVKSVYALPVVLNGSPVAVVALGHRGALSLSADDLAHVRSVADRVAVVVSAVQRDRQLYRQAHYDALTGLPNRAHMEDRLAQEIAHAHRDRQRLALLFIDLDRFKDVNDILGHAAGDSLLRTAAARLRGGARESDTVARIGGDEFVIVLTNTTPRGAQIAADNVMRVLSEPIAVDGRETFVSCSIGVAFYPDDGASGEELLRKADTAMYRAKQSGRGRYVFFEERMNTEAIERVAMEQDLRRAVERDELVMYFQPQVNLRSGAVLGAEMLVRWAHPTRGLLMPDKFISLAENAGLIESIGEHLLFRACAQYGRWRADGFEPGRLAVNVSSRQLRQRDFTDIVARALAAANLPASCLELEITESLLLDDAPEIVINFDRLKELGVRLAIDDFGTGYSSLAYLRRLPIHTIKIDRAFIRDVPRSEDASALVNTIISMARLLNKEIIAEGVENAEHAAFLLASGCQLAQGFGISRPLPAEEYARFVQASSRSRPSSARGAAAG
jgi:diguanylate cyclase (GGDEF)-like protein